MSQRSIRILYTVCGVVVLALATGNFLTYMVWRVPSNDQCEWLPVMDDSLSVFVDDVRDNSSAARAGLESGDVIVAVDGVPVDNSDSASSALRSVQQGGETMLTIRRDRRMRTVTWSRGPDDDDLPFKLTDRRGFVLVIRNIVPGGAADVAGAREGDLLLRIDGVSVLHRFGPSYLIDVHPEGSTAKFIVERDGALLQLDVRLVKIIDITYFAQFLLGIGFLFVGYFVVMVRPDGSIQRKFARFGYAALLFFAFSRTGISVMYDPLWLVYAMRTVVILVRILAPPTFLTFFLYFPYRHAVLDRKWFVPLLYMLSTIFTLPLLLDLLRISLFAERTARIFILLDYGFLLAGLVIFVVSYYSLRMRDRRRQLRPIMQSALIGAATFAYLIVMSTTYPLAAYLEPWLVAPAFLIVGIAPAFGYSIVKHRVMDVTVFVKRSIIYGIVTMAIAMIYLLLVFGLGNMVGAILGETDNKVLTVFAFVIIALVFDPLKKRVQNWVDRVFYRERYNYQKALLQFSSDLPRTRQLEDVLTSIVHTISSTMHVEKVGVGLCDDKIGCSLMSRGIPEDICSFRQSGNGMVQLLERTKAPVSFESPDEGQQRQLPEEERARIRASGVVLFIPILIQDRLIGAIIVGQKLSGALYSQEDLDLLSTVAGQAAIAIENARLLESEVEKQKYREQLAIAKRIQQGLLPREKPPISSLDISGVSIPAMSVGGDYFDYITLPGDRLLVVVADVAGKGMSAALYMARVQGLIRYAAHLYDSPRDILTSVNRHIYEGIERNSFVTMILALFDMSSGRVTVCRAGHTQPLIASNGHLSYLGSEGMGLGLEEGTLFEESLREVVVQMHAGNTFLLYSDGLTEAMDSRQQEFGEERVGRIVTESGDLSARELQDALLRSVESHRGSAEQHDDITLVVIRVLASPEEKGGA
jgi:sigma-B regulation protein RsbU (phosphoserine phosphatase)